MNVNGFIQALGLQIGFVTPKNLIKAVAPAVAAQIGNAVPTDKIWLINTVRLCNTTATDVTVDLWSVESGTSRADEDAELSSMVLKANESKIFAIDLVIGVGDSIHAAASTANSVSIRLTGGEKS